MRLSFSNCKLSAAVAITMSKEAKKLLNDIYEQDDLEALKLYIKKGFNVCAQHEQTRRTLLHVTASMTNLKQSERFIAEVLIDRGVAIDARDQNGRTALMLCRSTEIAAVLLARGAGLHVLCDLQVTALHHAAHNGNDAMVQLLQHYFQHCLLPVQSAE
jgi:ankyrin repeat protein